MIAVNCLILVLSVMELMLTSSIYDFIVTHELFYAYPKKTILIAPSQSLLKYIAISLSFFLSFASITHFSYRYQRLTHTYFTIMKSINFGTIASYISYSSTFNIDNLYYVPSKYRIAQFACAVLHAICSSNSFQTTQKLAIFISGDEEENFIAAAWWYTLRLRFSTILFAATSILILFLFFLNIRKNHRQSCKISSISYDLLIVERKEGMFYL
ncbi:Uncharacterized protein BM_BM10540 [Brugia malayi]|uniref:Bm10540 n=1 Tax=Brugia malayi TaxID=6279 RepID=A0A4E9FQ77_BRUMA|nr:Uncharacterized protein BM_BM10540 [Brugia malayi]VIO98857.1 Uncharacterized protein BM_BM10540 [Brugia malayi]